MRKGGSHLDRKHGSGPSAEEGLLDAMDDEFFKACRCGQVLDTMGRCRYHGLPKEDEDGQEPTD